MTSYLSIGNLSVGIIFLSLFGASTSFAGEWSPLFRGARAQAMGNAFTAVADDEQSLFYNPAGLAGIKQVSVHLASARLEMSNELISNYPTYSNALQSPSIDTLRQFIGKNIYGRAQANMIAVFPGFGFAGIYDVQSAVRLQNHAFPQGALGAQSTYGGQIGYGTRILKFPKKRGEVRVGFAGKLLWRSGGYKSPSLTQIFALDYKALTTNLNDYGMGFGLDFGTQAIYFLSKRLQLSVALAALDLGATSFNSAATPQQMNVTAGLALAYRAPDMTATLAYDYSNITNLMDPAKKNRLGLELKFPIISLAVGMNQLSLSYGVHLDLWLFRASYVSYSEDLGALANQNSEPRTMASISMKLEI